MTGTNTYVIPNHVPGTLWVSALHVLVIALQYTTATTLLPTGTLWVSVPMTLFQYACCLCHLIVLWYAVLPGALWVSVQSVLLLCT